jgi:hypothetical protein
MQGSASGITAPGNRGQVYEDIIANGATAVTSLTTMNVGTTSTAGTYTPKADGYLLKVTIVITPQAATSLAQTGWITLASTSFQPINTITIPIPGFGLATAPQAQNPLPFERNLNLPVRTALAITPQYIFQYSPVTPAIWVHGTFWANSKVTAT